MPDFHGDDSNADANFPDYLEGPLTQPRVVYTQLGRMSYDSNIDYPVNITLEDNGSMLSTLKVDYYPIETNYEPMSQQTVMCNISVIFEAIKEAITSQDFSDGDTSIYINAHYLHLSGSTDYVAPCVSRFFMSTSQNTRCLIEHTICDLLIEYVTNMEFIYPLHQSSRRIAIQWLTSRMCAVCLVAAQ